MTDYDGLWKQVLGTSWEDYTDYPKTLGKREGGDFDRNAVLRPWFNTVVRPDGVEILPGGLNKFYSDPSGLYCKTMAYELGKEDVISSLYEKGAWWGRLHEYQYIIKYLNAVKEAFGMTYQPRVLDHGCGLCHVSLYMLSRGYKVTAYDHDIPSRRLFLKALGKYGKYHNLCVEDLRFVNASVHDIDECGQFDAIISQDVLEHLKEPEKAIEMFAGMLPKGGLLLLGTFFNSCNGQDPQHLFEHDKYQDENLWFSVVESFGFEKVGKDFNGVQKVWRKS